MAVENSLAKGSSCAFNGCACCGWQYFDGRRVFLAGRCFRDICTCGEVATPERLVSATPTKCDLVLGIVRVVLGLFAVFERVADGAIRPRGGWFFAFLTNWGVLITAASLLASGTITIADWLKYSHSDDNGDAEAGARVGGSDGGLAAGAATRAPAAAETSHADADPPMSCVDFRRLAVLLAEVVLPLELVITIVFWTLLFDPVISHATPQGTFANITIHLMCFLFVLADSIVGRMPIFLIHIWLATGMAVIYVVFNAVWTVAAGEYIYNIMDWNGNAGGSVVVALATAVVTHIVYVLFWFTSTRVRDRMLGANPPASAPEPGTELADAGAIELRSKTADKPAAITPLVE